MRITQQIISRRSLITILSMILISVIYACKPDWIVDTDSMEQELSMDSTSPYLSSAILDDSSSDKSLVLTFSGTVEPTALLLNKSTTECSEGVQVSKDRFTSCLPISNEAAFSASNRSITIALGNTSDFRTLYQVKISQDIQDTVGNRLARQKILYF